MIKWMEHGFRFWLGLNYKNISICKISKRNLKVMCDRLTYKVINDQNAVEVDEETTSYS